MSRTIDGECPLCNREIEVELYDSGNCECGNEYWVDEYDVLTEDGDFYFCPYIDWNKREKS